MADIVKVESESAAVTEDHKRLRSDLVFYVVNSVVDGDGHRVPNIPTGIAWAGHMYRKTGNVFKYLIKTKAILEGLPGVFGPIPLHVIQDALVADNIDDYRGFIIDDVPSWGLYGEHGDQFPQPHRELEYEQVEENVIVVLG